MHFRPMLAPRYLRGSIRGSQIATPWRSSTTRSQDGVDGVVMGDDRGRPWQRRPVPRPAVGGGAARPFFPLWNIARQPARLLRNRVGCAARVVNLMEPRVEGRGHRRISRRLYDILEFQPRNAVAVCGRLHRSSSAERGRHPVRWLRGRMPRVRRRAPTRGIVRAMRRLGITLWLLGCAVIAVAGAQVNESAPAAEQAQTHHDSWRQWGGPNRNFIVNSTGLADKWAETGPPVLWARPLGTGHSAILVDDGRLFTMYRAGNGRAKQGPWDAEETVIAMDAATGKTIWEHKYPSRREDFSFGA